MTPRFGLCCTFQAQPIKFRTTTAKFTASLSPRERAAHLRQLASHNADALVDSLVWCAAHGIGAFRVNSQILPLATHAGLGYALEQIDNDGAIEARFRRAGAVAAEHGLRLSFHPDQFVVLGSAREEVVQSSVQELEYQAQVAEWIGAEQLTIHGGGAQGGKPAAIERLARGIDLLSARARARLVLENDDRVYTVRDLLPLCELKQVPLIYDVHHHRCNPDGLGEDEATEVASATWGAREPWVHLSSPSAGWAAADPRHHADYIDWSDVPAGWLERRMTIDVEAKAKELAVVALKTRWGAELGSSGEQQQGEAGGVTRARQKA